MYSLSSETSQALTLADDPMSTDNDNTRRLEKMYNATEEEMKTRLMNHHDMTYVYRNMRRKLRPSRYYNRYRFTLNSKQKRTRRSAKNDPCPIGFKPDPKNTSKCIGDYKLIS